MNKSPAVYHSKFSSIDDILPSMYTQGAWVRQAAVGFTTAVAEAYDISDIFCKLVPHVEPFLTRKALQLRKPVRFDTAFMDLLFVNPSFL